MGAHLKFLLTETFRDPRAAMRQVLGLELSRNTLWSALGLSVCLSVLLLHMADAISPADMSSMPIAVPISPIALAMLFAISMLMLVGATHFVGRGFGGSGSFDDSLCAIMWLQIVMIVLQLGQFILLLISPILSGLSAIIAIGLFVWLLVNFIAAVHGFASRGKVFLGMIGAAFGLSFVLNIVLSIVAQLLGVEIPNA